MSELSDAEIVGSVLNGDIDAFGLLVDRYQAKVLAIAGRRVPSSEAQEIAQRIFIAAFKSLGGFSRKKPFEHWLAGIAVRSCCDYWRSSGYSRSLRLEPDEDYCNWFEEIGQASSVEHCAKLLQRQETVEIMNLCLSQLKPEDRAVLELVYFEDLPLKEVAGMMEWGLAKTKIKAMRARNKLRDNIKQLMKEHKI